MLTLSGSLRADLDRVLLENGRQNRRTPIR